MQKRSLAVLILAALSSSAFAYQAGDIVVRGGIATVSPDDSSSNILVGGADAGLGGVGVDGNTQIGLTGAYFITDNINIEVLGSTPFTHDINLAGGGKIAETTHLPPTVTVNYYFADSSATFQPYVGAGFNYTYFFDEGFTGATKDALGVSNLELDASFGVSVTAGFDYMLDDKWHVNAAVRWADIDTEATFDIGEAKGKIAEVQIDPTVFQILVGYKF